MTTEQIRELFEKHNDEFIHFERIENPKTQRPDLHAFLLLDRLCPATGKQDLICCSEHDEYYLDIDLEALAASQISEADIIELTRCGARISEHDTICFFV